MKKKIIFLLIFILAFSAVSFGQSVGIEGEVSAYLLGDFENGTILEEYNIDKPLEVASITKLMTYLVVMDEMGKGDRSLDDLVYIDKDVSEVKGSSFNLKEGEIFPISTLIESLLIVSANDSAHALAKYVAGDVNTFVNMMNDKAKEIGLLNTVYLNPTGLPEGNRQNMMSTRDIFTLSRHILKKYPEILQITKKPCMDIYDREFINENTNPLLGEINGVDGLKTGFTNKAGYCLVSTMDIVANDYDEKDFRVIGIVMGTKSEEKRRDISKEFLEYGISNYTNKCIFSQDVPLDTVEISNAKKERVEVYPEKDIYSIVKVGDNIREELILNENISLPVEKGESIGKLVVYDNEDTIGEYNVVVKEKIKKANIFLRIWRYIKQLLLNG